MSRQRIWEWKSGGRRRYTLTDAHSEENVALYSQPDAHSPFVHKNSNSENHLHSVSGGLNATEYEISGRGTWRTLWGEWARDSEDADDEQESHDEGEGDEEEEEVEAVEMMEVEVEEVGLDALTCHESKGGEKVGKLDQTDILDGEKDMIDLRSDTEVNENVLDALNGNSNIKAEEEDHLSENSEDYKESFLESKKFSGSWEALEREQLLKENLDDTHVAEKDEASVVDDDTRVRMYAKQCFDTHAWTSQDLRRFLLCKAKHELGGIPQSNLHGELDDSKREGIVEVQADQQQHRGNDLFEPFSQSSSTSNKINTTSIKPGIKKENRRKSLIPMRQLHQSLQKVPNKDISKPKNQTTSFTQGLNKRNTFPPRVSGNGNCCGSVDLNHIMRRDISPPPPRARLWSLPTIIVTNVRETSNNSKSIGNPCRISVTDTESDSETMNYLTVPKQHIPRNKSTGYRKKPNQKKVKQEKYQELENLEQNFTQSCKHLQDPFLLELPSLLEQKKQHDEGELGSLLSLWSGSWPIPNDSDGTSESDSYDPGSPPPDDRQPQTSPVTMEYKDSYVSM
ncbi:unnamed protein product, partial [Meganyctiphanes norvegica]